MMIELEIFNYTIQMDISMEDNQNINAEQLFIDIKDFPKTVSDLHQDNKNEITEHRCYIFSWEELDNNKLLQQLSQGYKNNLNSHLYVN